MRFQFAQVVSELIESIAVRADTEGGQDGFVDLVGGPAGYYRSAVQQHFHQPDHARVVDLDAGILCGSNSDGQRQPLEQRKVDVYVQPLGLEGGESAGYFEQLLAHCGEMVQSLLQTEVGQVVGAGLVTQIGGELLILLDEGVAIVGTEDVMAMLDLFDDRAQLTLQFPGGALPEDLGDLVGRHAP